MAVPVVPFQAGQVLYAVSVGTKPESVEIPFYSNRAPTTTDTRFPIGKRWIYLNNSTWELLGFSTALGVISANWIQLAGSSGNIATITGTANQITASTISGATTLSIPATFIAPGSVTVTTKLNFATGANTSTGTSGAMTTGAVTVANTSVTANSLIFCYPDTLGTVTAPQAYRISAIVAGTSFTITSADATDTSTWKYMIIN